MSTASSATTAPPDVRRGSVAAWLAAARPRSLPVAISPVIVGAAFGWARGGEFDALTAALVLIASLLMQVVTNLQNDVGYTVRGAERGGTRTGLPRATAQGWLGIGQVRAAVVLVSVVATALGLWLFVQKGWPVLAIGSASLLAALAYMSGPRPIAYTPFGELTVLVFFGLVAVNGTDWVLTGEVGAATGWASLALGALAAAALAINNHRDTAHDAQVGRRTFAVCFGTRASQRLYLVLQWLPFVLLALIAHAGRSLWLLLPLALVPAARRLSVDFLRSAPGLAYNALLFRCFMLQLAFSALLAAGAMLGRATGW